MPLPALPAPVQKPVSGSTVFPINPRSHRLVYTEKSGEASFHCGLHHGAPHGDPCWLLGRVGLTRFLSGAAGCAVVQAATCLCLLYSKSDRGVVTCGSASHLAHATSLKPLKPRRNDADADLRLSALTALFSLPHQKSPYLANQV